MPSLPSELSGKGKENWEVAKEENRHRSVTHLRRASKKYVG